jgi:hypothetical protein
MKLTASFRFFSAISASTLSIALTSAFIAATAIACSSTTASTPTGTSGGTSGTATSGGTPASAADCASRCEAKFMKCGGDAPSAKSNCSSQVCNASPSAAQLTCLEAKSCDEIAGSTSFASLCPGSASTSGGTSGGTSGTSGTPAGVTCGTATCGATQYCALNYDSSAMTYSDGSCKAVPSACAAKTGGDLCTCMTENAGCPTSGIVSTKCNQDNGGLKFGCNN